MAKTKLLQHFGRLVMVLLVLLVGSDKDCIAGCKCSSRRTDFCRFEGRKAVCKTTNVHHLGKLVEDKLNVQTLDLSCNEITNITKASFSRFKNLHTISLAYNMIKVLSYDVFHGLNNLTVLNLTKNPLTSFSGNITGLLPSLSIIDVTDIPHWKPNRELFQLRMLRSIIGWSYSMRCSNCLLYRSNSTTLFADFIFTRSWCVSRVQKLKNQSQFVHLLNNTSFKFRCIYTDWCLRSQYLTVELKNECWSAALFAINCQSVFGYLAIIFNMIAFLTILTSKRLRSNTSMRLVCNMALSDFIIGVYIVVITVYLNSHPFIRLHFDSDVYCWKIGFLWVLGQSGSVITTFVLTLERYLNIVHSVRPDVRMTGRMAVILIAVCWSVAAVLTSYALYFNFYKFTFFCIPIRVTYGATTNIFGFTIFIGSVGLFFYLMCFLLYLHIYISAKRTAHDAGVKRESRLAKRIALIVFTNMAFFFLPVLFMGGLFIIFKEKNLTLGPSSNVLRYYFSNVFSVTCLCINSFCNPILYAFRHDSFKKVLKERFSWFHDNFLSPTLSRMRAIFNEASSQSTTSKSNVPSLPMASTAKVNPVFGMDLEKFPDSL